MKSALSKTFPKSSRIRKSREYRRVQGRGSRIRTSNLLVLYLPGKGKESRFGLTVSRKVGNAVTRNFIKRRLRESIRCERFALKGLWDVVFIATPRAAKADFKALNTDVLKAISKINRRHG